MLLSIPTLFLRTLPLSKTFTLGSMLTDVHQYSHRLFSLQDLRLYTNIRSARECKIVKK